MRCKAELPAHSSLVIGVLFILTATTSTVAQPSKLDIVDSALAREGYAVGGFGIADAALFYVEFWATRTRIPLPPRCAAHYRLMLSRPAVRQVLKEEGYRVE